MSLLLNADKAIRWTGYAVSAALGLRVLIGLAGTRRNGSVTSTLYELSQPVVTVFQPYTQNWRISHDTLFETAAAVGCGAVLVGFYVLAGVVRRMTGRLPD